MKFKSRKPKPPTGMEMTVTFMMPDNQSDEERKNTLIEFLDVVPEISEAVGAVWLKVNCSGIPSEVEDVLQVAFDKLNKRPELSLVVDNTPPAGTEA